MPDSNYTLIHRDAQLSIEDRNAVCAWSDATRKSMNTAAGATTSFVNGQLSH
jgi:hypothetical protein